MRLKALLYLALTIAGAVLVAGIGARLAVSAVERDAVDRIDAAFEAAGVDWAHARADGLQVILEGAADGENARFTALKTAANVVDTNRIIDATEIVESAALVPDFSFEILRNGTDLSIIGLVPGAAARTDVLVALTAVDEAAAFTDLMEAVDYPAPEGWQTASDYALRMVGDLPRSHIVVRPGAVTIEAFLDSQEALAVMEAAARDAAPDGLTLALSFQAPLGVASPFAFEARFDGGVMTVAACNADSETAQAAIAAALAGYGAEAPCDLALGAPSQDWSAAVIASLDILQRLGGGTIRIEDVDVGLIGPMGKDATVFEKERARLAGALPPVFSLRATLPTRPRPRDVEAPVAPELRAALAEDGHVVLSAPLRDETALIATRNFAAARFGHGRIAPSLRVDGSVPEGWSLRVLAGLDALSLLHAGEVLVTATGAQVSGISAAPEVAEKVAALMAERLGASATADITFDESLVVVDEVVTLSDAECERALASIMREFQISFAPNAATIDPGSQTVIDEIATVLTNCPDARFEIGGHTDSQGRESMNLGLSQARAESVLDALLARDVLLDNLTAKGYGEAEPIADNDTEEGRAANRRIAFKLLAAAEETEAEGADADEPN